MEQKMMVKEGLLIKNPEEERKLIRELVTTVEDAYSKMFLPMIAFNETKVKKDLRRVKKILERFS